MNEQLAWLCVKWSITVWWSGPAVGVQCVCEAYGIDLASEPQRERFQVKETLQVRLELFPSLSLPPSLPPLSSLSPSLPPSLPSSLPPYLPPSIPHSLPPSLTCLPLRHKLQDMFSRAAPANESSVKKAEAFKQQGDRLV